MKKALANIAINAAAIYPLLLVGIAEVWLTVAFPISVALMGMIPFCVVTLATQIYFKKNPGQVRRLSPFFIEIKIPFFRCSIISQKPSKVVVAEIDCEKIIRNLYKEMNTLPNQLTNNWTYIAITHDPVIRALTRRRGIINSYGLTFKLNCGKVRFKQIQRALLKGRCKECQPNKRNECEYRKMGEKKRRFYLIKFHTKDE